MKRREFMKAATAAPVAASGLLASMGVFASAAAADDKLERPKDVVRGAMRYRPLGKTGEEVSLLGVGGYHIGVPPEEEGIKIIRTAVDAGVNFMDNSWDYHDGGSEIRMGKALQDGYRKKVFLMTKIDGRTKKAAAQQIDDSLKRLQADVIDLMQHHEIIRMEDPDRTFAEGGAMEAFLDAKKAGKIRYIGFTGHKDPLVHLRMLEVAAKHDFHFDAVQMPLNVMDAHFRSFAHHVLPVLVKEGIGVLGMKPIASGAILKSKTATAAECLQYAMSLPTSVVISGMDSMDVLKHHLEVVQKFEPLTDEQTTALLQKTAEAAAEGKYELFKTSNPFDATASHPEWLG
jgi:predicted aldo/keto reductase-like oxidoreductase